jgi:hypothetical protein
MRPSAGIRDGKVTIMISPRTYLILFLAVSLSNAADVPGASVIKGACPFECCQFGVWKAVSKVNLYDSPKGSRVVATVQDGEEVTAETGEEHIAPLRIDVVFPKQDFDAGPHPKGGFKVGDVIYTTHHIPECGLGYYLNGEEATGDMPCLDDEVAEPLAKCKTPSAACWGKISGPVGKNDVWWVQVKMKSGKVGWTRQSDKFSGRDSCS